MNELLRQLLFLLEQRSSLAREIDGLHYFVISGDDGRRRPHHAHRRVFS